MRHPFDNRHQYRILMEDGDVVAEAFGYADEAFDALIDWTNKQMPLGITRTGLDTAVSAGGQPLRLVVAR